MNEELEEDLKKKGTGFGKQAARSVLISITYGWLNFFPAHSKRAREERALAAERRIKALQATCEHYFIELSARRFSYVVGVW